MKYYNGNIYYFVHFKFVILIFFNLYFIDYLPILDI